MFSNQQTNRPDSDAAERLKPVSSPFLTWPSLVGFLVLGLGIGLVAHWIVNDQENPNTVKPSRGLVKPSPALTPDQVVEIQIAGLNSNSAGNFGLQQCFEFSSPDNRIVTGPESRFFEMIKTEPYVRIMNANRIVIGKAVLAEVKYATALVSTVGIDSQCDLFRFYLSRQDRPPFEGCWMTDTVDWISSTSIQPQDQDQQEKEAKENLDSGPSISSFDSKQHTSKLPAFFIVVTSPSGDNGK